VKTVNLTLSPGQTDTKSMRVSVNLSNKLYAEFQARCESRGLKMDQALRQAVKKWNEPELTELFPMDLELPELELELPEFDLDLEDLK